MIHTIQLYTSLNSQEISEIEDKFDMDIKLIGDTLDKPYTGIKTTITKQHCNWGIYLVVDIIKLLGSLNFSEKEYPLIEHYLNS